MIIYLLFKETSDQYGTSEFVGSFSERWRAERHEFDYFKGCRCGIKETVVDEKDREPSLNMIRYQSILERTMK